MIKYRNSADLNNLAVGELILSAPDVRVAYDVLHNQPEMKLPTLRYCFDRNDKLPEPAERFHGKCRIINKAFSKVLKHHLNRFQLCLDLASIDAS
jgi:hypothetical protein